MRVVIRDRAAPRVGTLPPALYGPLAATRLGGTHVPIDQAEVEHFREQAGPGLILLSFTSPHAVLAAGGVMLELANSCDWNDRGVLMRPFTRPVTATTDKWTTRGLPHRATIAYQRLAIEPARVDCDLVSRRAARMLEAQVASEIRRTETA